MTSPIPTADGNFPAHLLPLAEEICERYYRAFPDTDERYGARGRAYCAHDNAYLVAWLLQAVELDALAVFERNATWLASLLAAREFPLSRFIENLRFVAESIVAKGLAPESAVRAVLDPALEALAEPGT